MNEIYNTVKKFVYDINPLIKKYIVYVTINELKKGKILKNIYIDTGLKEVTYDYYNADSETHKITKSE